MKQQSTPYVEVKQVTWTKDSHGLFDYESKNVNFNKSKVEAAARVYRDGTDITIRSSNKSRSLADELVNRESNYLFSVTHNGEKNGDFYLNCDKNFTNDDSEKIFLIVRSLKNDDGTQRGYTLAVGDIVKMGRIEYRVIEYRGDNAQSIKSLLSGTFESPEPVPFSMVVKDCSGPSETKKQCRICLMDEDDMPEELVNPCSCKGTSEYVHIQCMQDWINSKLKTKANTDTTCHYWKKLICEVCKVSLPDLVEVTGGAKKELVPIQRPDQPYILLERVFYDKSKENPDNSKTMILLSISGDRQFIKMGRGHDCDLRENDISVSRLHCLIKYNNGSFSIFDNNSKFGTLVLLRSEVQIEKKKKIAVQLGRTVITFSLKQTSVNSIPVFRSQMGKLTHIPTVKPVKNPSQTDLSNYTKHRTMVLDVENDLVENENRPSINFLD